MQGPKVQTLDYLKPWSNRRHMMEAKRKAKTLGSNNWPLLQDP